MLVRVVVATITITMDLFQTASMVLKWLRVQQFSWIDQTGELEA